jgi:hypothetical protein
MRRTEEEFQQRLGNLKEKVSWIAFFIVAWSYNVVLLSYNYFIHYRNEHWKKISLIFGKGKRSSIKRRLSFDATANVWHLVDC